MKPFLAACVAMIVIGVIAWGVLGTIDMSSSDVYVSERGSVRL